jgi:hypothetical protein
MKRSLFTLLFILVILSVTKAENYSDTSSVLGRWDITINISGKDLPSWLEVERSGSRILVGRFVGPGGSARPISQVNLSNGKLSFSIPPQWETQSNNLNLKQLSKVIAWLVYYLSRWKKLQILCGSCTRFNP